MPEYQQQWDNGCCYIFISLCAAHCIWRKNQIKRTTHRQYKPFDIRFTGLRRAVDFPIVCEPFLSYCFVNGCWGALFFFLRFCRACSYLSYFVCTPFAARFFFLLEKILFFFFCLVIIIDISSMCLDLKFE